MDRQLVDSSGPRPSLPPLSTVTSRSVSSWSDLRLPPPPHKDQGLLAMPDLPPRLPPIRVPQAPHGKGSTRNGQMYAFDTIRAADVPKRDVSDSYRRPEVTDMPLRSPTNTMKMDAAMTDQLRQAERALFARPEAGARSPVGTPNTLRASATPSLSDSPSPPAHLSPFCFGSPSSSPHIVPGTPDTGAQSRRPSRSEQPVAAAQWTANFPLNILPPAPSQQRRREMQAVNGRKRQPNEKR